MTRKRSDKGRITRQWYIDSTMEELLARGFHDRLWPNIQEDGRRCGKGNIYYYFKNESDLVYTTMSEQGTSVLATCFKQLFASLDKELLPGEQDRAQFRLRSLTTTVLDRKSRLHNILIIILLRPYNKGLQAAHLVQSAYQELENILEEQLILALPKHDGHEICQLRTDLVLVLVGSIVASTLPNFDRLIVHGSLESSIERILSSRTS